MKTKTLLTFTVLLFVGMQSHAQFWKKLGKRAGEVAEETVMRKVEEKTAEKTEKAMDTILNADKKIKKKKPGQNNEPTNDEMYEDEYEEESENQGSRQVVSAKDFIPGTKVLYADTFSNDAIGDFPVTWNTNASAEVVMFEGDDTRWLQLANSGEFTPDGITAIPNNSTFEFDLYVPKNYSFFSSGIYINLVEVEEKRKDFMKWTHHKKGKNGVRLWLHPTVAGGYTNTGRTGVYTFVNGEKILDNSNTSDQFTIDNSLVHVSIWRQESRIRIYLNDKKVWDLPRAFDTANYNSVTFSVAHGQADSNFHVANLRLAVAGEDQRHALLETGHFETNEILFDVGLSSLQMDSTTILDELGQLLEENQDFGLTIIGHTDADGAAETNQTLSEDRAKSVKEYLTDNFAIKGSRLQTEGRGATVPVDSNETEEGKQKNRRVEFIKN